MAKSQLIIYKDKRTLAQAGSQRIVLALLRTLSPTSAGNCNDGTTGEHCNLVLTGGSDTIQALQDMATNPLLPSIPWGRVNIWWADERFVPAGDSNRNDLQAKKLLLDDLVNRGLLPKTNIHPMPSDSRSIEQRTRASKHDNEQILAQAADSYSQELIRELGPNPCFDLLILGMGPDGHFASLFPGHQQVSETRELVVGEADSPKMPPLRISMTPPLMARSCRAWFLTAGQEKARSLAQVFDEPNNPLYPASFADAREELLWLTTPDAAALLR